MSLKVKEVAIKDYQKNNILVTGIVSDCGNFVAAAGMRKFKEASIKEKPTSKGGAIITVAMGDVQLFGVKAGTVSEADADGYVTAELFPILANSHSVSIMKHRNKDDKEYGDAFSGSFIEAVIVKKNGDKETPVCKMTELLVPSAIEVIETAFNLCLDEKIKHARNAKNAHMAAIFANVTAPKTTEAQTEQAEQGAIPQGRTIDDVMPG